MNLLRLLQNFRRDFRIWDRPSQSAFVIALALTLLFAAAFFVVPAQGRQTWLIGLGGMLLVTQLIVLWGNRGLVAAYTQAQRRFIAGDYEAARTLLEKMRTENQADVRALTLLGNAYRQLGKLDESENVLRAALDKESLHPFPLYGFGRTLLAKGAYAEAAETLKQALHAGTIIAQFDLAEAHYRQQQYDEARRLLEAVRPTLREPFRVLMAAYLLYQMGAGAAPSSAMLREGLPYWQDSAQRFQTTPYGAALAQDISQMHSLMEGQ